MANSGANPTDERGEPSHTPIRERNPNVPEETARETNDELELVRERRMMMEMMTIMSQQLNELKRGRSDTLEATNPNPTPTKRSTIFKPQPHKELYTRGLLNRHYLRS